MSTTPTEHGARWRASLLAKAIEIAGTATDTQDSRTLVAMFDDELEAFAGYVLDASGRVDAGYRQGWEDVRDALGLRGNLPVSNAQYHASVLMPKLREVIRAATPVPVESLGRVPRAEHSPPRATCNAWHWRLEGFLPEGPAVVGEDFARGWNACHDAMLAASTSGLAGLPAINPDIPKPDAQAPMHDEDA